MRDISVECMWPVITYKRRLRGEMGVYDYYYHQSGKKDDKNFNLKNED